MNLMRFKFFFINHRNSWFSAVTLQHYYGKCELRGRGDVPLTVRRGCRCGEGRALAHYVQDNKVEKDEKADGF